MNPEQIIMEALDNYQSLLISYAREITGEMESAKDAVQDTFIRLSRQNLSDLQPRLRPWLFIVCRNCALDHIRKVVKFSADSVEEHDRVSEDPSPDERAMATEEGRQIWDMVAGLPLQQREIVKLKFEADLSYKEMAEILKTSVSTIGVQLHEAMETLRNRWNRETTEPA
jgi:RNA polymerase sigma-70 factor (ECF subfamily)